MLFSIRGICLEVVVLVLVLYIKYTILVTAGVYVCFLLLSCVCTSNQSFFMSLMHRVIYIPTQYHIP